MTQEQAEEIIKEVQELLHLLGWTTAGVMDKEGALIGMYAGDIEWVLSKTGSPPDHKPTH